MREEITDKKDCQTGEIQRISNEYEKPVLKSINTEYELNGIVGNCSMGQTDTAVISNKRKEL